MNLENLYNMGNKRNLKHSINNICSELFTETIAASLYGSNVNKDNVEAILAAIVLLRNNYIGRVSHVEPGMNAKDYFKDLREKFDADTNEIIDQICSLG